MSHICNLLCAVLVCFVTSGSAQSVSRSPNGAEYAEIVRIVVLQLAPPADFSAFNSVSIFLDLERTVSSEQVSAIQAAYPASVVIRLGNNHVLDKETRCFRDSQRNVPALGIGIGETRVTPVGDILVEAGSAMCILGTVQNTYRLRKVGGRWTVVDVARDLTI
jgi:hypothetical protein